MSTIPVAVNGRALDINLLPETADTLERHASSLQLSSEEYLNTILKNWFNAVESVDCRRCGHDMYRISERESHLRVELKDDFCFGTIRTIIRNLTSLPLYRSMDDIWIIGRHHALISLGDIEELVADFRCLCSRSASGRKTAVVVDEGQTESRVHLWVDGVDHQLPFECRIFHTLAEAEAWLGAADCSAA